MSRECVVVGGFVALVVVRLYGDRHPCQSSVLGGLKVFEAFEVLPRRPPSLPQSVRVRAARGRWTPTAPGSCRLDCCVRRGRRRPGSGARRRRRLHHALDQGNREHGALCGLTVRFFFDRCDLFVVFLLHFDFGDGGEAARTSTTADDDAPLHEFFFLLHQELMMLFQLRRRRRRRRSLFGRLGGRAERMLHRGGGRGGVGRGGGGRCHHGSASDSVEFVRHGGRGDRGGGGENGKDVASRRILQTGRGNQGRAVV